MKKHFKIQVFGRVQGVWFRDSTEKKAQELGVFGWVRNESDGSVLIVAEGEENALNDFIDWCDEGPEMAKVESVEITEGKVEDFHDFQIHY